jgi:hypothetical protein
MLGSTVNISATITQILQGMIVPLMCLLK